MSQAKLEFLAGKSVPAIIDWMLENMKETDIRGCLDAAGIQTSVGSRSAPLSSSGAGSSTDPLPPLRDPLSLRPLRTPGAGSSTDPLPFSRAAAAGSSTDPLPFSRAAAAGLSTAPPPFSRVPSRESLPFFTPGAATGFLSRTPSEEQIRSGFYEPPSLFRREPSDEMVNDPYSGFPAPGARLPLLGNDFGGRYNILLNKLIKFQLQEQKRAREEGQLGNSINYIPLLIFDLEDMGGMQYLSFIIIEPVYDNEMFRTRIMKINADKEGNTSNKELELLFETKINTLLNQWVNFLYNTSIEDISDKIDLSFENFINENNLGDIYRTIQKLYSRENINMINSNNFGYEEDDMQAENEKYMFRDEDLNNEYSDREDLNNEYSDHEDLNNEYSDHKDSSKETPDSFSTNPFQLKPIPNKLIPNKPILIPVKQKKFGKISDMNTEELREYVINKFGTTFYNEYEPQVYTTKTGFGNVRYVKRSSPLTDSRISVPNYDYSIEQPENSAVNLFD
jgi:hypothetical protein